MSRWARAVVGFSFVACAGLPSATQPSPTSLGTTLADARGTLAQAAVSRQPASALYVSVVENDMRRTGVITEQREPGFELVLSGSEHITAGTAPASRVEGGRAVFVPGDAVTRFEPDGAALTYFVSLRPAPCGRVRSHRVGARSMSRPTCPERRRRRAATRTRSSFWSFSPEPRCRRTCTVGSSPPM